jgi:PAS domain S-box-containing protein
MPINDRDTLNILFEHSLDLICVAASNGFFQKLSKSWTVQLGWSIEELLSRPFIEIIHPDDREPTFGVVKTLHAGETLIDFENRYRAKDGQYHWIQWRAHVDPKNPDYIFAIGRDITQAKSEEIRTQNDIALLKMAEQTARIGHWYLDARTGDLEWSNEVYHIFARKQNKAKITLEDFIDVFTKEDRKNLWVLIQNAVQNAIEIDIELSFLRSDAEERIIIMRTICEKNDDGSIKGLFGIIQDVTLERLHQHKLNSKEELLSMAFRATSDGIWDWDLRTDQIWYSPQWKHQLGYADDEIENHFNSWGNLVFEEDRLKAMDAIENHIQGNTDRYEIILRFHHKQGHTVFILTRAFAIRDASGRAIRMVGAHTDVTEIKKLEQAKSEFTSIVSHELRTPLTAIHGAIGLLLGHYCAELPEQVRHLIQLAHNNSQRLILLVNDILDMEKLQYGRMDFDIHEITLGEFLPQAVENHQSYAEQFNVSLNYNHGADDLTIMGDSNRLMQVISNLLSNAIRFSDEGGEVSIRAISHKNNVAISINDTGCGIDPSMQNKIFDKFYQVDSSDQRNIGGSGLGLAISKSMVENMGGTLSLTSKVNVGSTFTVHMPRG